MEQDNNREETSLRTLSRLQILQEVAFSLNLVTAAGYALLVYIYKNDLDYYLRRTAIKVDDLLHLSQTNAVTTEALRRNSQNLWSLQAGIEFTVLISVFAALMIVLLILRLSGTTRMYRLIMGNRFSGLAALFAVPFSYLSLWKIVWQPDSNPAAQSLSGHPLFGQMFTADILCVCALFLINQSRPFSTWTIGILLILHYVFWLPVLLPPLFTSFQIVSVLAPLLLVAVFPFSGIVWLLHMKAKNENPAETSNARTPGKWTLACVVVSLAMCLVIWLPGRAYPLTHPRDMESVTVQMWRGVCFGTCPSYSIALHGSGLVEYHGTRFVGADGQQTATINSEKLMQVLRDLDRLHFFTLEDRAFGWCYDSASISIAVSIDGRTKRVTSDTCGGGKSGPQARLVQVADEIDTISDSKRWVTCGGNCPK